jgi:endoribonuclease LACTB2
VQPELIPLGRNLLMIRGRNQGRFPMAHAFLVEDKISALIDTGCGINLLKEIKRTHRIDILINSHGHPDHSAGNWLFPGVPLFAPKVCSDSHGRLEALSLRFFGNNALAGRWMRWIREVMEFKDREPTDYYDQDYVFDFGNTRLQAIHTPGHTRDHFCFLEPETGILLSFDIDLTPFGPWYGNRESNLADFRESISRIRQLKPAVIASSHFEPISEKIDESIDDYLNVIGKRTEVLTRMLKNGATEADLLETSPIYGRYPYEPEILRFFEARMISMHIEEINCK